MCLSLRWYLKWQRILHLFTAEALNKRKDCITTYEVHWCSSPINSYSCAHYSMLCCSVVNIHWKSCIQHLLFIIHRAFHARPRTWHIHLLHTYKVYTALYTTINASAKMQQNCFVLVLHFYNKVKKKSQKYAVVVKSLHILEKKLLIMTVATIKLSSYLPRLYPPLALFTRSITHTRAAPSLKGTAPQHTDQPH